jgi:surface protein
MENMFQFCNGLTEIDALNWDTSKVLDSESMFAHCTNLTTIYVGNNWSMVQVVYRPEDKEQNIEKLSSENMFTGCKLLVGGLGTGYNSANVDKTYAIIDGGTSNPGYLTQGPAPTTP